MTDQFTNQRGLAAAHRVQTGGFSVWGSEIWDAVCYIGASGETFHASEVAEAFAPQHLAPRTARSYVYAFLAYAMTVPEEFSGRASRVTRCGKAYRLVDAGE